MHTTTFVVAALSLVTVFVNGAAYSALYCLVGVASTKTTKKTTTTTVPVVVAKPTTTTTVAQTTISTTVVKTTTTTLKATATAAVGSTALKTLAAVKGIYFGCAVDNDEIVNSNLAALAGAQCGLTTPGNAMKCYATEPTQGKFTFTDAEAIMIQLASWVTSGTWTNATLTAVMVNHIMQVVTHFKGRLLHWDVVNEAFNDDGTFRDNVFYQNIGEAYIGIAARCKTSHLRAQGIPIDEIGSQMHLTVGNLSSSLASNLKLLASTGAEVAIT
ncbi:hypothetical protein HK100_008461 [Physocladia obscura]|uniref:endo-1,4-beta-xylanase n=1 Tax=Physocladia obscura TaxID=109957 RepID=A0AAD5XAK6_9FUNG|nr:hypothetical protein HK100_008461 [Physocladia obscura]